MSGGVITFDGTDDVVAFAATVSDVRALTMASCVDLPSASGSGANGGFTCSSGRWVIRAVCLRTLR